MTDEPCTLEHLQAVVPTYNRWDVKPDGELGDTWDWGVMGGEDTADIEEYVCDNCGEYFTPTERYDLAALAEAWQAALAHLSSVRTSEGRIVRVEVTP